MASKILNGKIEFLSGEESKEIVLSQLYDSNSIVINITSEKNENIYFKKEQGQIDRFVIYKSNEEPNVVYYVVLEI